MIKSNELRIGNWVECLLLGNYKLRSGDIDEERAKEIYKPIPLTPEILEQSGFKKDRHGWNLPNTKFSLTEKFYPCWLDRMLWPQDIEDFKDCSIKYLHQLQNLYFWLSGGEELTINFKDLTYQ